MPKYTCDFKLTICGTATVEAATPEAAYDAVSEAAGDEYTSSTSLYMGEKVEFEFLEGEEGTLTLLEDSCEIDVYRPVEVPHE